MAGALTRFLGIPSGDEISESATQAGHRLSHRKDARKEHVASDLMESAEEIAEEKTPTLAPASTNTCSVYILTVCFLNVA
ncbi:hypothetical protein Y032_0020g118 [Ancylostoma ceylanicum]|uniref:Uncharacterized protein n=1 Tax=Ancylostoma ceylanicum TaxID=53326 RepID=A0A016V0A3_9BILA|nr:hypothetical protein Y032_0020g118 [Ancylostoma ceylanicum]